MPSIRGIGYDMIEVSLPETVQEPKTAARVEGTHTIAEGSER
jgi:hypothetical protein